VIGRQETAVEQNYSLKFQAFFFLASVFAQLSAELNVKFYNTIVLQRKVRAIKQLFLHTPGAKSVFSTDLRYFSLNKNKKK